MTGKKLFALTAVAAFALLAIPWGSAGASPQYGVVVGPRYYGRPYYYHRYYPYRRYYPPVVVVRPRPVVVAPAPLAVAPPAPLVVTPPPVVVSPAPTVVQPVPVQPAVPPSAAYPPAPY